MSCHECFCHIAPPCGGCTSCQHADHPDCPNPCDECTDHEEDQ